jgi:UDP-N-acetylglucosamine--N-acetylmuramyl-(pentapeptide) pyrophosphoryl-undecaprenol N-acetylglucosamine transferase
MKIIFAGGKTGGHIYPGIALAESFKEKQADVYFLSPYNELDKKILTQHKIKFFRILSCSPFNYLGKGENQSSHSCEGKNSDSYFRGIRNLCAVIARRLCRRSNLLKFAFFSFIGIVQSLFYILKIKPDIIYGLGGYPSFPAIIAGRVLRKRIILLEQNVKPGKANLCLARFVNYIYVSFEETREFFKKNSNKVIVTGNPIRKSIKKAKYISKKYVCDKFNLNQEKSIILIMGGSQGAKVINETMVKIIATKENQFIHITGKQDYESIKQEYIKNNINNVIVLDFCEQIGELMAVSDLIVSRAGATTLSEIMYLEKKAILIPYAKAANNHQYENAKVLERKGLAVIVNENELDVKRVNQEIFKIKDEVFFNVNIGS